MKILNPHLKAAAILYVFSSSDKLTPPRETYIVWVETESNVVKNWSDKYSQWAIFKETEGFIKRSPAFKPNNIFIMAEDIQNVQYPGNLIVLTTK